MKKDEVDGRVLWIRAAQASKKRMMEEEELVVLRKVGGGERGRCQRQSPGHDSRPVLRLWFAQVPLRLFSSPSRLYTTIPPPLPLGRLYLLILIFPFFSFSQIID